MQAQEALVFLVGTRLALGFYVEPKIVVSEVSEAPYAAIHAALAHRVLAARDKPCIDLRELPSLVWSNRTMATEREAL